MPFSGARIMLFYIELYKQTTTVELNSYLYENLLATAWVNNSLGYVLH